MQTVTKVHLGGYIVIAMVMALTLTLDACAEQPTAPVLVERVDAVVDSVRWIDVDSLLLVIKDQNDLIDDLTAELNGEWGDFNQD